MNMKKNKLTILAAITVLGLTVFSGCGAGAGDPGEPPAEVVNGGSIDTEDINPEDADKENKSVQAGGNDGMDVTEGADAYESEILTNAISVRVGRDGTEEWNVDMYQIGRAHV